MAACRACNLRKGNRTPVESGFILRAKPAPPRRFAWIYAATGSIRAAILAHAALNTVHLLLFTYPALTQ